MKHGSGAVVLGRINAKRDQEKLEAKLTPVLTDMVLAGLTRVEVNAVVNNVLNNLIGSQSR